LEIEGIPGESIEVLSWSWGMSQSGSTRREAGSGLATGKRQHKPITITKEWDKATPLLFKAMADGTHFPTVIIKASRMGATGQREQVYEIRLTNVRVATGDVDGDGAADRTSGSGSGAGKVSMQDFHFALLYDDITITDVASKNTVTISTTN
jgi:type VI secretion system secreted protein Hcp